MIIELAYKFSNKKKEIQISVRDLSKKIPDKLITRRHPQTDLVMQSAGVLSVASEFLGYMLKAVEPVDPMPVAAFFASIDTLPPGRELADFSFGVSTTTRLWIPDNFGDVRYFVDPVCLDIRQIRVKGPAECDNINSGYVAALAWYTEKMEFSGTLFRVHHVNLYGTYEEAVVASWGWLAVLRGTAHQEAEAATKRLDSLALKMRKRAQLEKQGQQDDGN